MYTLPTDEFLKCFILHDMDWVVNLYTQRNGFLLISTVSKINFEWATLLRTAKIQDEVMLEWSNKVLELTIKKKNHKIINRKSQIIILANFFFISGIYFLSKPPNLFD